MKKRIRKPTKKQIETRDFMRKFSIKNKRPPTLKEIANHFDIAIVSAFERVRRCKRNLNACPYCGHDL